jgi:hypothetical protein
MTWKHVQFKPLGCVLSIPISKTGVDQSLNLNRRNDNVCPVRMLEEWKRVTGGGAEDYVFTFINCKDVISKRKLRDVYLADYVKDGVTLINEDSSLFAAHSTRSGFVSSNADSGVSLENIRKISRHKNVSG